MQRSSVFVIWWDCRLCSLTTEPSWQTSSRLASARFCFPLPTRSVNHKWYIIYKKISYCASEKVHHRFFFLKNISFFVFFFLSLNPEIPDWGVGWWNQPIGAEVYCTDTCEKGGETNRRRGESESEEKGIVAQWRNYAITMGTSSAKPPIMGSSSSSSPFGGGTKRHISKRNTNQIWKF